MNTTYHVLLATVQGNLPECFGSQDSIDQSGTYILVDCGMTEDFNASYPNLSSYVPGSYPSYMTAIASDPLNCTRSEAASIIATFGASGSAWRAEEMKAPQ